MAESGGNAMRWLETASAAAATTTTTRRTPTTFMAVTRTTTNCGAVAAEDVAGKNCLDSAPAVQRITHSMATSSPRKINTQIAKLSYANPAEPHLTSTEAASLRSPRKTVKPITTMVQRIQLDPMTTPPTTPQQSNERTPKSAACLEDFHKKKNERAQEIREIQNMLDAIAKDKVLQGSDSSGDASNAAEKKNIVIVKGATKVQPQTADKPVSAAKIVDNTAVATKAATVVIPQAMSFRRAKTSLQLQPSPSKKAATTRLSRNTTRTSLPAARSQSSQPPATKSSELLPAEVAAAEAARKAKSSYNRDEARRFMEEQRKKRRAANTAAGGVVVGTTTNTGGTTQQSALERQQIKQRLEELRKNSRKIVSKNLAKKRIGSELAHVELGATSTDMGEIHFKRTTARNVQRKTATHEQQSHPNEEQPQKQMQLPQKKQKQAENQQQPQKQLQKEQPLQKQPQQPLQKQPTPQQNDKNQQHVTNKTSTIVAAASVKTTDSLMTPRPVPAATTVCNALLENQKRIGLLRKPELKDHSFSAIKEFSFDKENVALQMLTPSVPATAHEPRFKDKFTSNNTMAVAVARTAAEVAAKAAATTRSTIKAAATAEEPTVLETISKTASTTVAEVAAITVEKVAITAEKLAATEKALEAATIALAAATAAKPIKEVATTTMVNQAPATTTFAAATTSTTTLPVDVLPLELKTPSARLRERTSVRDSDIDTRTESTPVVAAAAAIESASNVRAELPYWLKPSAVQIYPYNFIMAVRRKLEAIANPSMQQSKDKLHEETPRSTLSKQVQQEQNEQQLKHQQNHQSKQHKSDQQSHQQQFQPQQKRPPPNVKRRLLSNNSFVTDSNSKKASSMSAASSSVAAANLPNSAQSLHSDLTSNFSSISLQLPATHTLSALSSLKIERPKNTKHVNDVYLTDDDVVDSEIVADIADDTTVSSSIFNSPEKRYAPAATAKASNKSEPLTAAQRPPSPLCLESIERMQIISHKVTKHSKNTAIFNGTYSKASHIDVASDSPHNSYNVNSAKGASSKITSSKFSASKVSSFIASSKVGASEIASAKTASTDSVSFNHKTSTKASTYDAASFEVASSRATSCYSAAASITSKREQLKNAIAVRHVTAERGDQLHTMHANAVATTPVSGGGINFNRLLQDFNRSLSQVIEVNEQLKSTLDKSHQIFSPERKSKSSAATTYSADFEAATVSSNKNKSDSNHSSSSNKALHLNLNSVLNSAANTTQTTTALSSTPPTPPSSLDQRLQTIEQLKQNLRATITAAKANRSAAEELNSSSGGSSSRASGKSKRQNSKIIEDLDEAEETEPLTADIADSNAATFVVNDAAVTMSPPSSSVTSTAHSIAEQLQFVVESPPSSKANCKAAAFSDSASDFSAILPVSPASSSARYFQSHINSSRGDFLSMLDENAVSNESHFLAAAAEAAAVVSPPSYNAVTRNIYVANDGTATAKSIGSATTTTTTTTTSRSQQFCTNQTTLGSEIVAVFNQSDMELSIVSTQNDGSLSETSLNYSSVGVYEKLIQNETTKSEHLGALLKMREKALLDRTKGQIAWLEVLKERYKAKGLVVQISAIKKKQRGILLKMEKEREEIKRLLQSNNTASIATAASQHSTAQEAAGLQINSLTQRKRSVERHSAASAVPQTAPPVLRPPPLLRQLPKTARTAAAAQDHQHHQQKQQHQLQQTHCSGSAPIVRANYALESNRSLEELLRKREDDLRRRREHVERLMQWHQRLDQEEADVLHLEHMLLTYNNAQQQLLPQRVSTQQQPQKSSPQHNQQPTSQLSPDKQQLQPKQRERSMRADKMERRLQEIDRSLLQLSSISTNNNNSSSETDKDCVRTTGCKLNRLWRRLTAQQVDKFEPNRRYKLCKADLERLYEEAKVTVLREFGRDEERIAVELLDKTANSEKADVCSSGTTRTSNCNSSSGSGSSSRGSRAHNLTIPSLKLNLSCEQSEADFEQPLLEEEALTTAASTASSSFYASQATSSSPPSSCSEAAAAADTREQLIERNVQKFLALTQRFNGTQSLAGASVSTAATPTATVDGLQRSLSDTQIAENGIVGCRNKTSKNSANISQRNIAYYGVKAPKKTSQRVNVEIANSLSSASNILSASGATATSSKSRATTPNVSPTSMSTATAAVDAIDNDDTEFAALSARSCDNIPTNAAPTTEATASPPTTLAAPKATFSAQHVSSASADCKAQEISAKLAEISLAVSLLTPTTSNALNSMQQQSESQSTKTSSHSLQSPPYSNSWSNSSKSSSDNNSCLNSPPISPQTHNLRLTTSLHSESNCRPLVDASETEHQLLSKYTADFETDADETRLEDLSFPVNESSVDTTQELDVGAEISTCAANVKLSPTQRENLKLSPTSTPPSPSMSIVPTPKSPPALTLPQPPTASSSSSSELTTTSVASTPTTSTPTPIVVTPTPSTTPPPPPPKAPSAVAPTATTANSTPSPPPQQQQPQPPAAYTRAIPNKPPPPYVPPAHGSPMTTIFPSVDRIKDLTYRRTHELYCEILKTEYTNSQGTPLPSVMSEQITNIFERIILDICREYLQEHREALFHNATDASQHHSQLALFNPPDRLRCIQTFVYKEVRRCLAMDKTQPKRTQIYSVYGQRSAKRDHIGKIIIQEMCDEDDKWCNFHREETEVLDLIVEEMLANVMGTLARDVLVEEGGTVEEQENKEEDDSVKLSVQQQNETTHESDTEHSTCHTALESTLNAISVAVQKPENLEEAHHEMFESGCSAKAAVAATLT